MYYTFDSHLMIIQLLSCLVFGCWSGEVYIILYLIAINMCFLRYVDAENERLKKVTFIEKNSVYLFRIINTCKQLRYLLMMFK